VQNPSPDPGGVLFPAIYKNHDAELSFWREPDIGRSVVQPAVLVDDQEGSGSDVLPGEEALLEVGIHGEHGLLRETHRILHRAMVGELRPCSQRGTSPCPATMNKSDRRLAI